MNLNVSKLFRAYGLYNNILKPIKFNIRFTVSKLFRAYGLYNYFPLHHQFRYLHVSKLFRAYGLYNLCSLEGA